jgi:hypothetical protein
MVVVGWIVLAVVSDPSGAPVKVTGATGCPAAEAVEAAVAGLIGPPDPAAVPDVATMTDDADSVVVTLRRASGEELGAKRLDAGLACDQRARAAAVVIAAWEARLGTQATTLVVQPTAAAPAAEITAAGARADADMAPPPPRFRIEPGVSVGAAMNGTTLAPAGTIEVAFSRPGGTVVPAVGALAVGTHTATVGPGQGSWRRFGLLATVGSRRAWSATWLEARGGVALTVLDISGGLLPRNDSGKTFDPGVPIGARFGVRSGPVRWWLEGLVAFWPRMQSLYVTGAPGTTPLPRGEALISMGASYEGL